jgi:hypothetical protein
MSVPNLHVRSSIRIQGAQYPAPKLQSRQTKFFCLWGSIVGQATMDDEENNSLRFKLNCTFSVLMVSRPLCLGDDITERKRLLLIIRLRAGLLQPPVYKGR